MQLLMKLLEREKESVYELPESVHLSTVFGSSISTNSENVSFFFKNSAVIISLVRNFMLLLSC